MPQDAQTDWYTWGEFTDACRALMPMENQRLGLQDEDGVDGFITRNIRLAVIDLQNYVTTYRKNHETIYYPQDFVTEGFASKAVAPPHAHIKEIWFINNKADDAGNFRYPATRMDYGQRFELINGIKLLPDQHGRIAFDDAGYNFYAYPVVGDGWVLSVFWDGMGVGNVKLDFQTDELVPFEEDCAECVADYVKSKIAREVDKDMQMYGSYRDSFMSKRRDLYLRNKDKVSFE